MAATRRRSYRREDEAADEYRAQEPTGLGDTLTRHRTPVRSQMSHELGPDLTCVAGRGAAGRR